MTKKFFSTNIPLFIFAVENCCISRAFDWQGRWIPWTNQGRDGLIEQKVTGSGLKSKWTQIYASSQAEQIFTQTLIDGRLAMAFKKNDPPIIALESYLHHFLKMTRMIEQPAPKICKIIIWIYLAVLLRTAWTLYNGCHGSSWTTLSLCLCWVQMGQTGNELTKSGFLQVFFSLAK